MSNDPRRIMDLDDVVDALRKEILPSSGRMATIEKDIESIRSELARIARFIEGHGPDAPAAVRMERLDGSLRDVVDRLRKISAAYEDDLDGSGDRPGIKTRIRLLEEFEKRQKWFTGTLAAFVVALLARVLATYLLGAGR